MNTPTLTPPHTGPSYEIAADDDRGFSIDFTRILDAIKKHFWIILLFLTAGTVGAIAFLNIATPIYQSVAVVKVEQRIKDASPTMTVDGGYEDLRSLEMLGTIQRGFLSRSLLLRVADKLKLTERPGFIPANTPPADKEQETIEALAKHIDAQVIRGTRLIQVSFENPSPELATEVVDAVLREYIALDGEQRLRAASGSLTYLESERKRLEDKLRETQMKLSEYTKKLGSISVDSEMNIIAEQLRELNARLTVAKAERLKLEADFAQIQEVKDDPQALLQIASVAELPEVQEVKVRLNEIDGELARARQRYGSEAPQIAELVSQREGVEESLYATALRAPRTVEVALRAAIQNEKSLERETQAQEKKTIEVKDLAIQAQVLQREIETDQAAFQITLQRLNEEMAEARSQPIFIQTVDPPSPGIQVKPRPLLVVAVALFLALGGSAATIFLLAILDTSFKSVDDVEQTMGMPVLAAIPNLPPMTGKNSKKDDPRAESRLPLLEDQHSTVSEAFRTLRASFLMLETEQPYVLITSATPAEGKSFCSINIAVALAQQGQRTLLVDADLRKPAVEKRLFERGRAPGLTDFLLGEADFDDIIRETQVPNLYVITAGRHVSSPAELLLRRERFRDMLSQMEAKFDRGVVDSAPLLAVSDTLNIANNFRTIAMVVRSHKTARRLVKRGADLLARAGHPCSGLVLNMVPARAAAYYYYYSYGTGRTYGAPVNDQEVPQT